MRQRRAGPDGKIAAEVSGRIDNVDGRLDRMERRVGMLEAGTKLMREQIQEFSNRLKAFKLIAQTEDPAAAPAPAKPSPSKPRPVTPVRPAAQGRASAA